MTATMLVRTAAGAWERLEPQTKVPDGGITDIFGDDIGPVLGRSAPMVVAAASPKLATGRPDAICVDAEGNLTLVALALTANADKTLPSLLSYAGALHGMSYEDFSKLCNRTAGADGDLAGYVHGFNLHADFHQGTFEVTVADALSQGRFELVAVVSNASPAMVQSMRYMNASGADVGCYEALSFASDSVMAVQANLVDVGQQQRQATLSMTAAGLLALTERSTDPSTAKLMSLLQKFCATTFDEVVYGGDASGATMAARLRVGGVDVFLLSAASDGSVNLSFESLANVDGDWSVRAELCQDMNRMLGADLGDVRKISQLNLNIREHLMDATLMEAFTEILGDTAQTLRADAGASSTNAASAAAA